MTDASTTPSADPAEPPEVTPVEPAYRDTARLVIGRLLPYLKPYSGRIGIAMVCLLTAKVAGLAVPLMLKRLVDAMSLTPSLLVLPVALLLAYGAA